MNRLVKQAAIETVGDKFRFHLKSGPVDLDRRTVERICFKWPSI